MDERIRRLWTETEVEVWPATYRMVLLPGDAAAEAGGRVATAAAGGTFAALVVEGDTCSLTIEERILRASGIEARARAVSGPLAIVSLVSELPFDVVGYFAPAALRLASAGIAIVPQCGFRHDHVVVAAADLPRAMAVLEALIAECRAG